MRRKIATWSLVFILLLLCGTIVSNFPRSVDVIELENGVKITIEVNENIMAMRDPVVTKTITIDYGKRQLTHKSTYDDYDYQIFLLKEKKGEIWVMQEADGYQTVACSFSDKNAEFSERYSVTVKGAPNDTLLKIRYEDFVFNLEHQR